MLNDLPKLSLSRACRGVNGQAKTAPRNPLWVQARSPAELGSDCTARARMCTTQRPGRVYTYFGATTHHLHSCDREFGLRPCALHVRVQVARRPTCLGRATLAHSSWPFFATHQSLDTPCRKSAPEISLYFTFFRINYPKYLYPSAVGGLTCRTIIVLTVFIADVA